MDKPEFRESLKRNNLTCKKFSQLAGVSLSQVYSWGSEYPVPYYARLIIQMLDDRGGAYGLYGNGNMPPGERGNR